MKKFNINQHMYIQITEAGWDHLRKTVGEDYIKHSINNKKVEIEGETWYKLQCYETFNLLPVGMGTKIYFNSNVMFDDNSIETVNEKPEIKLYSYKCRKCHSTYDKITMILAFCPRNLGYDNNGNLQECGGDLKEL